MATANYNLADTLYQRLMLSPLGLDRENAVAFWMLILFGTLTLGGLWYFEGEIPVVLAILYVTGIFILSFLRIDYSLYLLFAGVMTMDQFAIPGFSSITHEISFFSNLKEIPYLPFFSAGVINPVELHILFLVLSLLILISVDKNMSFTAIPVWIPFTLFFFSLVGSFVYGLQGGGDILVALWEVRALFYLCIMYLIVPQIIRTRRQINVLLWIFIIGVTLKAFQGIGRFVSLGFTTGGFDVLTNHEDPVFTVTLLILLAGFMVYKVDTRQRLWLFVLLLPLLLGFYVAQRRAAYASLMVSVCTFIVLLPMLKRWYFLKFFLPVLAFLMLYGVVFWNSGSTLGRPVQMIKSGLEKPSSETNYRDYNSNLYREFENYNLASTVAGNPITGTGFGKKYDQPIPLAAINFTLSEYIPHNQILWVLVKMGGIGFLTFWFFFNSIAAKGTQVFFRLEDPYLKVVALFIVVAIINQMVVSYFDLQLTYYRNMLYLGCLIGIIPALERISLTDNSDDQNARGESGRTVA
ncbi:MAG: O-antigen ligase family protein [Balneolaceae bacterium]